MNCPVQFGIIGQGLAGSLLAFQLMQRGCTVRVWQSPLPGSASLVGPGLLNPLIGKKFEPIRDHNILWKLARDFYTQLSSATDQQFLHEMPVIRFFTDANQRALLEANLAQQPPWSSTVEQIADPGSFGEIWNDRFGAVLMRGGGWVDMAGLCAAVQNLLREKGVLQDECIDIPAALQQAEVIIDCGGWRTSTRQEWSFIEHNPARGEIIVVRLPPDSLDPAVWHFGNWLQPLGNDLWRMGATYAWSNFEAPPTLSGQTTLELSMRRWLNLPFQTVDCRTGVRPAIRDYRPVVGRHPTINNLFICSGFGSHGALYGPYCVNALLEHLFNQAALPDSINCQRFSR